MECPPDLTEKVSSAKQLYSVQSYDECSSLIQVIFDKYLKITFEIFLF